MPPSVERVRELLDYDPETGVFTWKRKRGCRAKGDVAGCVRRFKAARTQYLAIRVEDHLYLAHRLAWFYTIGVWPVNEIDHRDGDGLNNRWDNLREATDAQNKWNSPRRRQNTSGAKGVHYLKRSKQYVAHITYQRQSRYLGLFATLEEAAAAYDKAARELFGEFARLNALGEKVA